MPYNNTFKLWGHHILCHYVLGMFVDLQTGSNVLVFMTEKMKDSPVRESWLQEEDSSQVDTDPA